MFSRSRFNPKPGVLDFWNEFRKPNPYRWPIMLASMLPIGLIILWASGERVFASPERPEITYITTFSADQTDEEIIARNEEFQAEKDELAARRAEVLARKKEVYRTLGRATGIDVDAMEEDIATREAQEQAAASSPAQAAEPNEQ